MRYRAALPLDAVTVAMSADPLQAHSSSLEELAAAWLACTLPKAQWTHAAHLRIGLWHLLRYPPREALARLRERIACYNLATGVANTDSTGYHETLTRFWIVMIAQLLETYDRSLRPEAIADRLIQDLGDRNLPLRFWTRERLMSSFARRDWLPPDLGPLGSDPFAS